MSDDLYSALEAAIPDPRKALFALADGSEVSYGETFALAGRIANLFKARGVVPGDRVAVQVDKPWQAVAVFLASLRAGAVYLPLNAGYTPTEIAYFLGDAEARLFVCRPESLATLAPVAREAGVAALETLGNDGSGSLLEAAALESDAFATVPRAADDLAAILYTSGTTGRSKG
ncbi:MAG: AMP-binding protein, partial [Geminicoccaceae bacterium]|nr:AMP-binding protein [Geminicoccaceae bacterium]